MDNTNNFLESIKKHSEEERASMLREVEEYKAQELGKAEEKGKADAQHYINKLISEKKAEITSEYAIKNLEAKGDLLKKRDKMINDIFKDAEQKLLGFAQSDEYKTKLIKDAEEISRLFEGNACVLYIKNDDMKYADDIKAVFNSDTEIKADIKIIIGGIRGYCEAKGIIADNTLDSKLEEQRYLFVENAQLKIN